MAELNVLYVSIFLGPIFVMACWQYRERRLRRQAEQCAASERAKIREIAESAASEAKSCAAVIDHMDIKPRPRRRRLRAVRDNHTGQSHWDWDLE